MTLSFDGRALEPPAEGWRRDFIVHLAGWAKDHDPNTVAFRTAEPLPHRGMKSYGAAEVDPFRLPGGPLSEYRQSYQTRRAPPLVAPATGISKDIERWVDENRELAQRRLETQQ